jgi:hypothetical protein
MPRLQGEPHIVDGKINAKIMVGIVRDAGLTVEQCRDDL